MSVLEIRNPTIRSFVYGSLSGTCSTLLFQPLDLVKTRMQSQSSIVLNQHGKTKKLGMFQVMVQVVKKERLPGLWKGTIPSLIRCVPGVGIYFGTLDYLSIKLLKNPKQPKPIEAMLLGFTARTVTVITLLPVTVIKTRYESGLFSYANVWIAIQNIYQSEGFKGSFRGLLPTLFRDVPFSGLYYLCYSQLKQTLVNGKQNSPELLPRSFKTFVCGLIAGLFASTVTHPADVVKTRIQIEPQRYFSISQTIKIIYKDGDVFRGLTPRIIRRTLMTALTWTIFEFLIQRSDKN
ncbi:mitochondrial glycine transporter [Tetranychus urticae]|nr:mitochondrial glycine transporter [Tetranychus urticae]